MVAEVSYEIDLRWMPQDLTDDKSTLVKVMAWCRQGGWGGGVGVGVGVGGWGWGVGGWGGGGGWVGGGGGGVLLLPWCQWSNPEGYWYNRWAGHIYASKLKISASANGLSPGRHQDIIRPLGTNFSAMLIEIHTLSFKKMNLKMSSAKWWSSCLGLNVLTHCSWETLNKYWKLKFPGAIFECHMLCIFNNFIL